jgi:hypothetical protein
MHHAEATSDDWLELAAEARRLADDPGISPECREYHERAAVDFEIAAIAARLAGRIPLDMRKLP